VAKILVADDNSNIQKMVVLALKDQGIDVVAVGNGEAAVRKISDVRPDLVLADVFMPVRNGYEVCKFVKESSSLSHVPVILLVGAFDPLDEQEAQRVGADGVLKKPFVPPDPLISMVKSALARSGVSLEGSKSSAPLPPPPPAAAKLEPALVPKVATPLPSISVPAPAGVPEEDFVVANSAPARAPLSIEPGTQPVAFGSLLDAPVIEEDAVFSISPSTGTVPDRDWSSANRADEPQEEQEEKAASWRLSTGEVDGPAGQEDWHEAAFAGVAEGTGENSKAWAPSVEKNSLAISEEEAAALEREQQAFSSSIGSSTKPDWAKEISAVFPPKTALVPAPPALVEKLAVAQDESKIAEIPPAVPVIAEPAVPAQVDAVPAQVNATPAAPSVASPDPNPFASSWAQPANHPWEDALNRANDLAASWDSVKLTPEPANGEPAELVAEPEPAAVSAVAVPEMAEILHEADPEVEAPAVSAYAAESMLSPAETQELKEELAEVTETQAIPRYEEVAQPATESATPAAATGPSTDELVAQILAKMNPEVLQAVTREILKPIIQAMVQEQLGKK
jgi:CheY-like chemotaxis protein